MEHQPDTETRNDIRVRHSSLLRGSLKRERLDHSIAISSLAAR